MFCRTSCSLRSKATNRTMEWECFHKSAQMGSIWRKKSRECSKITTDNHKEGPLVWWLALLNHSEKPPPQGLLVLLGSRMCFICQLRVVQRKHHARYHYNIERFSASIMYLYETPEGRGKRRQHHTYVSKISADLNSVKKMTISFLPR